MVALRWCSQENEGGRLPLSDNGHTLFPIIAVLLVDNSSLLGGGQAEVMTSPSSDLSAAQFFKSLQKPDTIL